MRCADCDLTMNRHAQKLLKSAPLSRHDKPDSLAEEYLVVSIHACPGCGKIEMVGESPGIKLPRAGI
jgi:hypothetical protein